MQFTAAILSVILASAGFASPIADPQAWRGNSGIVRAPQTKPFQLAQVAAEPPRTQVWTSRGSTQQALEEHKVLTEGNQQGVRRQYFCLSQLGCPECQNVKYKSNAEVS